jgi:hypothetical protein
MAMHNEVYSDGVSEIVVTGSIIRIDFMSLAPREQDAEGRAAQVHRSRIIMPAEAFANSVQLMRKVLNELIENGAVRPTEPAEDEKTPVMLPNGRPRNFSPNFS